MQMTLHIVRSEGLKGLYKGMSASYLGVAEGTIQWVLYERLKKMGADNTSKREEGKVSGKLSSMVGAAGVAKLVASLITYPHEVVRTRLRQQPEPGQRAKYTGLVQTVKLVYREEGLAALYGGFERASAEGGAECGGYVLDLRADVEARYQGRVAQTFKCICIVDCIDAHSSHPLMGMSSVEMRCSELCGTIAPRQLESAWPRSIGRRHSSVAWRFKGGAGG